MFHQDRTAESMTEMQLSAVARMTEMQLSAVARMQQLLTAMAGGQEQKSLASF
jgi:hypothetical protein